MLKPISASAALLAMMLLAGSCGDKSSPNSDSVGTPWSQTSAEAEYRLLRTELGLANSKHPYLVVDLKRREVCLKLEGAVVWNHKIEVEEASVGDLESFGENFLGGDQRFVRPLMAKYLFASQEKTPDSILAIVSEATRVKAELMQRELPARFQLVWTDDLILDIRTEAQGFPRSKFQNTLREIRQAIKKPLGATVIPVRMTKEAALTLYRATPPGIQTLVYPTNVTVTLEDDARAKESRKQRPARDK